MITSDQAYETIQEIKRLRGNSKQEFLKVQDPEICRYLHAAYNPFIKFNVTSKAVLLGKGKEQFNEYTWKVLNALAKSRLTGGAAIQTVKSHTFNLTEKSSRLFGMILDKDLRFGMGIKTINKVYPGLIPVHDVMLAKLLDKDHLLYPCFNSPKIDGLRTQYKNGKFFSRNGHEFKGLTRLHDSLSQFDDNLILDGELIIPGETFQKTSGQIRNFQEVDALFHIFEIPSLRAPFTERLITIEDIEYSTPDNVYAVPHVICENYKELMKLYKYYRDAGFEGSVVKPIDYEYKGTRSYDWMKIKPKETVDLKVIELFEGKGKYKGQMGGAIVMFNGKENRVGSGFSDMQREYFWDNMDEIVGKTIEIDYMEETDYGNMRHARFIRFREDKD